LQAELPPFEGAVNWLTPAIQEKEAAPFEGGPEMGDGQTFQRSEC